MLYYPCVDLRFNTSSSENYPDVIDCLKQGELIQSNLKCRDTYRPVLIARDVQPVLDQVHRLDDYYKFMKAIIPIWRACRQLNEKKQKSYSVRS